MKSIFFKLPGYYLIVLTFLAGYSPPISINPIFLGCMAILILQIIFRNRTSGIVIGVLFFLINLYFLGALIAEFNEFTDFNKGAKQLLLVGLSIWIINVILSVTMIYKYAINNLNDNTQVLLEKQSI